MNQPKRLHKQTDSMRTVDKINEWCTAHPTHLLLITYCVLFCIVILLLRQLLTIETGMMRNFIINGV